MSATERNRIANPGFFCSRGQRPRLTPRVRLIHEIRGQTPTNKKRTSGSDPEFPVPAFLQRGFTYIGLLIVIAVMGMGLAAFGELYSHAAQRDKEQELLFVGDQFRQAIASYYNRSPGAKVFPQKIDDLLEDKRFPMPQHHLRKLYRDPVTGSTDWALVEAPGGGFMGVHSRSDDAPVKTGGFAVADEAFEGAEHYADWAFTYSPPGLGRSIDRDRSR
jgi:type II secretory pathway pseudopilin PulG